MKAKMPQEQAPVSAGEYLCVWCDATFHLSRGLLKCPSCGNANRDDLVTIYVEDNPREEALYCPIDWHGG